MSGIHIVGEIEDAAICTRGGLFPVVDRLGSGELVVILRDIEDLPYDQIAAILRIRQGTVKSRLHRGREALRGMLKELVS